MEETKYDDLGVPGDSLRVWTFEGDVYLLNRESKARAAVGLTDTQAEALAADLMKRVVAIRRARPLEKAA
jgi:hypothetical protein